MLTFRLIPNWIWGIIAFFLICGIFISGYAALLIAVIAGTVLLLLFVGSVLLEKWIYGWKKR